ncbi:MAG: hypothetical protein J6D28_05215 [Bacilli bacterium]|nr:hypothetical protein [Bacilli bacterium]MBP3920949.1 hypothetical protein [Bacilli bacterium]
MIYVPDTNYQCFVLVNKDTIRAYETKPYNPGYNHQIHINYRDYYINSHYLYSDGSQTFNDYSQIPICLDSNNITNDFYYRNDFDSILFIFVILFIFIIYIPYRIISRLFGRWLKV